MLSTGIDGEAKYPLKTVEKTIRIIELVQDTDYGSITKIANELDLNTDDGERLEGLRGVGAPVKTSDGFPLGSISIAAPASRVDEERFNERFPDRVCSAANVVELNTKC